MGQGGGRGRENVAMAFARLLADAAGELRGDGGPALGALLGDEGAQHRVLGIRPRPLDDEAVLLVVVAVLFDRVVVELERGRAARVDGHGRRRSGALARPRLARLLGRREVGREGVKVERSLEAVVGIRARRLGGPAGGPERRARRAR